MTAGGRSRDQRSRRSIRVEKIKSVRPRNRQLPKTLLLRNWFFNCISSDLKVFLNSLNEGRLGYGSNNSIHLLSSLKMKWKWLKFRTREKIMEIACAPGFDLSSKSATTNKTSEAPSLGEYGLVRLIDCQDILTLFMKIRVGKDDDESSLQNEVPT